MADNNGDVIRKDPAYSKVTPEVREAIAGLADAIKPGPDNRGRVEKALHLTGSPDEVAAARINTIKEALSSEITAREAHANGWTQAEQAVYDKRSKGGMFPKDVGNEIAEVALGFKDRESLAGPLAKLTGMSPEEMQKLLHKATIGEQEMLSSDKNQQQEGKKLFSEASRTLSAAVDQVLDTAIDKVVAPAAASPQQADPLRR